jgi:dynein light chain 1
MRGKKYDCASALEAANKDSEPSQNHLSEMRTLNLAGNYPPIETMDKVLSRLVKCEKLSLSTNAIDRIQNLSADIPLKVLSLGRNNLKKLDGIEPLAATLEQIWISYNSIDKLSGIETCTKLRVLYISNNKISDWEEINKLGSLPDLQDVLFIGNPLYNRYKKKNQMDEYKQEMLKRLPHLKKLDGEIVDAGQEEE